MWGGKIVAASAVLYTLSKKECVSLVFVISFIFIKKNKTTSSAVVRSDGSGHKWAPEAFCLRLGDDDMMAVHCPSVQLLVERVRRVIQGGFWFCSLYSVPPRLPTLVSPVTSLIIRNSCASFDATNPAHMEGVSSGRTVCSFSSSRGFQVLWAQSRFLKTHLHPRVP